MNFGHIYGYKIVIREAKQKMRLSENVTVTDEFRKMMDNWMAEFFGYEDDNKHVYVSNDMQCIFMSQKAFDELKKQELIS